MNYISITKVRSFLKIGAVFFSALHAERADSLILLNLLFAISSLVQVSNLF